MSRIRQASPGRAPVRPAPPRSVTAHGAGEVIERHRHENHQLSYVSTGVLAIQTERGAWVASHDRAVWVPAGVWHQHRFYGPSSFHTVGVALRGAPLPADAPTVVAVGPLLRELLIAYTDPTLADPEAHRMAAVLRDQLRRATLAPLVLPSAADGRLADACRLVEDGLDRPRTLAVLSRAVGTSERTLARLFRTEFGMTYPQWRTNLRVFHAMVLLSEGASVTETARRCGWATTSAFIDTFARTMGQTPGAYRAGPAA